MKRIIIFLLLICSLSGCRTIASGMMQDIVFIYANGYVLDKQGQVIYNYANGYVLTKTEKWFTLIDMDMCLTEKTRWFMITEMVMY